MKLGILFSGGKDSTYACYLAQQKEDAVCLISLLSLNKESYMFHTPNVNLTRIQAEAMGIPLVERTTEGEKEKELSDLKAAILEAREKYGIEGVVTGAIESVYQAERVERICNELGLWCFSPLWLKDQEELLREVVSLGFKVMISGVFAYPLDDKWLGRVIDEKTILELVLLRDKYGMSPSGEGGEIETTVLDGPNFSNKVVVQDSSVSYSEHSGVFVVKKAECVKK